jgi:hypothetical protein
MSAEQLIILVANILLSSQHYPRARASGRQPAWPGPHQLHARFSVAKELVNRLLPWATTLTPTARLYKYKACTDTATVFLQEV